VTILNCHQCCCASALAEDAVEKCELVHALME
jgi:hypothetical protein